MKKKKILALAVLFLTAALFAALWVATRPETAEGTKTITVTVVHKDGTEKAFSYTTEAEYLGAVLVSEGLAEGEMGPYGLMIHAVDGETADYSVDGGYWALFIGEEYAVTGADTTPIENGGQYRLVYTIG